MLKATLLIKFANADIKTLGKRDKDCGFETSLISMLAVFLPADSISISEVGHCRALYIIYYVSIRNRISIRPGNEASTSGLSDRPHYWCLAADLELPPLDLDWLVVGIHFELCSVKFQISMSFSETQFRTALIIPAFVPWRLLARNGRKLFRFRERKALLRLDAVVTLL